MFLILRPRSDTGEHMMTRPKWRDLAFWESATICFCLSFVILLDFFLAHLGFWDVPVLPILGLVLLVQGFRRWSLDLKKNGDCQGSGKSDRQGDGQGASPASGYESNGSSASRG